MNQYCVLDARVGASGTILLVLLWTAVLVWVHRRSAPIDNRWQALKAHRGRVFASPLVIGAYAVYVLSQATLLDSGSMMPDVARCAAETWWQRISSASSVMSVWMFFVTLPLLPRFDPVSERKWLYASATVAGILLRLFALVLLSHAIITGEWTLNRIVTIITLFILPALARVTRRRALHARFKASSIGAFATLWPTLLVPITSRYALIVQCVFVVAACVLLYRALERAPAVGGISKGVGPQSVQQAASREGFEQIDSEEYINGKHGVRLRGLNDWTTQALGREFEASGGFLALDSPDGSATINLSSGPLTPLAAVAGVSGNRGDFVKAWERHAMQRFEEDRRRQGGGAIRRIELTDVDGEQEVIRLEFDTSAGRVGKVCAMHQGDEFVLFYFLRHGSPISIENILGNWKWFMRLRADLTGLGEPQDVVSPTAHSVGIASSRSLEVKARVEVTVAGFLFSVGAIGPVGCIRLGRSLGLKGTIGIRGMGDDFLVVAEGEPSALEEFIKSMTDACPWLTRFVRRFGFAGGLLVNWREATGQFDSLPAEMPFTQIALPDRR